MKKDLGVVPAVYPMPVLMIATYDESGKVDVMNAGWGQIASMNKIALFISEGHKTTRNIRRMKAFTVSLADEPHVKEADFFGMATGNRMEDKFERTGLHARKSSYVNAPVIEELPIVMECELDDIIEGSVHAVIGKIVNVSAEESVLDENGKVDPLKLHAIMVDQFKGNYYVTGEKVGKVYRSGRDLMKE